MTAVPSTIHDITEETTTATADAAVGVGALVFAALVHADGLHAVQVRRRGARR